MFALKPTKQLFFNFCLLCMLLPLTVHQASAQISIGGITISKPRRVNKPKAEHPATTETKPIEPATTSSSTKTNVPEEKEVAKEPEDDMRISVFLSDIAKAKREVNDYTPTTMLYLVSSGDSSASLLRAVSPRARQEFLTAWKGAKGINKLIAPYDDLAATAAPKLSTYKPEAKEFTFHNPAEERMIKGVLSNLATLKIMKVGIREGSWLIDKNDIGLPTSRYKHGHVWARDTNDDHPYCHLYYVNISQEYAGGGTYAASSAQLVEDELVGCQ